MDLLAFPIELSCLSGPPRQPALPEVKLEEERSPDKIIKGPPNLIQSTFADSYPAPLSKTSSQRASPSSDHTQETLPTQ